MPPLSTPRFSLNAQHWPWRQHLPHLQLVSCRFTHAPLSPKELIHHHFQLPSSLANASPKRRAEFMAGRLCARHALVLLQDIKSVPGMNSVQSRESVLDIGPDRAPIWPQDIVGSISHSDRWAATMVAKQTHYLAVGLDIERCLNDDEGQRLMPALLTATERQRLALLNQKQLGFMVTLTFSLKESLFKALYPLLGKPFYFEDAELIDWNNASGSARLRLVNTLGPDWPKGRELAAQFCHYDDHIWSLVAVPTQ